MARMGKMIHEQLSRSVIGVEIFSDTHAAQMLGYLNITRLKLALLPNFKNVTLSWNRSVAPNVDPNPPDLHA